jgi:hypothetical protein
MKRLFVLLIVIIITITIKAQLYISGSVGLCGVKVGGNDTQTSFKIVPDIGYVINDKWSVGLAVGYKQGACLVGYGLYGQNVNSKAFGIQPYVRYNVWQFEVVDFFVDGVASIETIKDEGTNYNGGLRPGILFNVTPRIGIVSHIGFMGIEYYHPKGAGSKCCIAGMDFDINNITLGINYKF